MHTEPRRELIEPWSSLWRWKKADWEIRINHVHREGNCCADALAELSFSLDYEENMWTMPPCSVEEILFKDSRNIGMTRLVRDTV